MKYRHIGIRASKLKAAGENGVKLMDIFNNTMWTLKYKPEMLHNRTHRLYVM
jgi:hypothetical protein